MPFDNQGGSGRGIGPFSHGPPWQCRKVCISRTGNRNRVGPRLQISRRRRTLRFDGRDVVLSMVGFDALVGAAEKVVAGDVLLTYQELYSLANTSGHRDVLKEIRDQLAKHGIPRKDAFGLVKTKHGRGVTIGLPPEDIVIRD